MIFFFFFNGIFKGLESGVMYILVQIYKKNLNLCDLNMFNRTVGGLAIVKKNEIFISFDLHHNFVVSFLAVASSFY